MMMHILLIVPVMAGLFPYSLAAPHANNGLIDRAAICGSKGYDDGTESFYSDGRGTYAKCSAACQKKTQCKSFSYGDGECNLYNVPVVGNFNADSDSPYVFYDISCVVATSSTTKKPSSTTSSVVKTSSSSLPTKTSSNTPSTTSTKATNTTSSKLTTTSTPTPTTSQEPTFATPPCPGPTWTMTNFKFFNSSHNLDCAGADASSPLCSTGLDPQPPGYGPPDSVQLNVSPDIGDCIQQNPGSVPLRPVGNGVVRCGGSQKQVSFFGTSNAPQSVPQVQVQNQIHCPDGSSYEGHADLDVLMDCAHDGGNNATCVLHTPTWIFSVQYFENAVGPDGNPLTPSSGTVP